MPGPSTPSCSTSKTSAPASRQPMLVRPPRPPMHAPSPPHAAPQARLFGWRRGGSHPRRQWGYNPNSSSLGVDRHILLFSLSLLTRYVDLAGLVCSCALHGRNGAELRGHAPGIRGAGHWYGVALLRPVLTSAYRRCEHCYDRAAQAAALNEQIRAGPGCLPHHRPPGRTALGYRSDHPGTGSLRHRPSHHPRRGGTPTCDPRVSPTRR